MNQQTRVARHATRLEYTITTLDLLSLALSLSHSRAVVITRWNRCACARLLQYWGCGGTAAPKTMLARAYGSHVSGLRARVNSWWRAREPKSRRRLYRAG